MNRQRGTSPKPILTPNQFIVQVQQALDQLMQGFMRDFDKAGVIFDEDETDEIVTLIFNEWCEQEVPDYELNLKMCAAVYLSAVLDMMYGEDQPQPIRGGREPMNNNNTSRSASAIDLGLDILKTVRSVFGKEVT